jgi:hypothetical protein
MNFLLEMISRLQTESPKFFITLRYVSGVLAIVAFVIRQVIADKVWEPHTSEKIFIVCGYFISAAVAIWGSSFLPNKSANEKAN